MGKSAPSPPPQPAIPDPVKTAEAQGAINKDTAIAQATLNMVDEYTPYGSSVYEQTGSYDGTPRYKRTTALDPAQQSIVDKQNAVTNALNDTAVSQVGRVDEALAKPFSYEGIVEAGTTSGARAAADRTSEIANSDYNYAGQPQAPSSAGIRDAATTAAGSIGTPFSLGGTAPTIGGISGAADAAQAGMSKEFNYRGLPGSFDATGAQNAVQTATDAYGTPLDYSNAPAAPQADAAARQQVIDSVYQQQASRLDPRFEGEQRAMETKLANSGISRGSEAFSGSMDDFYRGKNDAYQSAQNAAIQAGGAEQSRLFGLGTSARQNAIAEQNYLRSRPGAEQGQLLGYQGQLSGLQGQARDDAAQERLTERGIPIQEAGQLQALRGAEFDASSAVRDRSVQEQLLQRGMPAQEQAQIQQMQQSAFNAQGSERDRAIQEGLAQRAIPLSEQQQAFSMQQGLFGLDQAARQRAIEESAYLRNLPLNETSALMSGNQINNPQFGAAPQTAIANTDYAGMVANKYNAEVNAANAAASASASASAAKSGSIAGLAGTAMTAGAMMY
jgi:hypothetical protein|tara:strand:- start:4916 stop:6589 length:1674 start_codon:yes stop_codon:yes gene_type:complete